MAAPTCLNCLYCCTGLANSSRCGLSYPKMYDTNITCRQTPRSGSDDNQSRIINEARGKFQAGVVRWHCWHGCLRSPRGA